MTITENATVTATGGDRGGAGIGGGSCVGQNGGAGGTVVISGSATVTATGGDGYGAGIGGGGGVLGSLMAGPLTGGAGATVTISGSATVTATGANGTAGIGGGCGFVMGEGTKTPGANGSLTATGMIVKGGTTSANAAEQNDYATARWAYMTVSAPTRYDITKAAATNGSFTVKVGGSEVTSAAEAATVTVAPSPAENYVLDTITVTKTGDTNTKETVTNSTFTMPAYPVTVTVTFKKVVYAVSGTVSAGTTGASVSGLTVNLYVAGAGFVTALGSGTSDAAGAYTIDSAVENGDYLARIVGKDGKYDYSSTLITVNGAAVTNADITLANVPAAPAAVRAADVTKTGTTITISNTVSGQEYSIDGGTTWQDSGIFTGLTENQIYSVVTRIKATANASAGLSSAALSVKTVTPGTTSVANPDLAGAPSGTIVNDANLASKVSLTDADRAALDAGTSISFQVKVELATPTQADKDTINDALSGGTVGMYLNVSVLKKVGNAAPSNVTELRAPIRITIPIPTELQKQGRTFAMLSLHNGTVSRLPDLDNDPATYTIESAEFSVYTLIYADAKAPATPDTTTPAAATASPKTGDGSNLGGWALLLAVCVSGLLALVVVQKRKKHSAR